MCVDCLEMGHQSERPRLLQKKKIWNLVRVPFLFTLYAFHFFQWCIWSTLASKQKKNRKTEKR